MPKQYLNLMGQPIAMHSLKTFGHMPEVGEIVVVCDPSYRCRPAVSPPILLVTWQCPCTAKAWHVLQHTTLLSSICRDLFQEHLNQLPSTVKHKFAVPGIERQDSVYSGLQEIRAEAALLAVHDSARPLLDSTDAAACMADAHEVSPPAYRPGAKELYPSVLGLLACLSVWFLLASHLPRGTIASM